jgi:hypothetical protein
VNAISGVRRLSFCPECYQVEPEGGSCACTAPAPRPVEEDSGRFAAAVDAPRIAPPVDRTRRLLPAMVGAGVLIIVVLLAAMIP